MRKLLLFSLFTGLLLAQKPAHGTAPATNAVKLPTTAALELRNLEWQLSRLQVQMNTLNSQYQTTAKSINDKGAALNSAIAKLLQEQAEKQGLNLKDYNFDDQTLEFVRKSPAKK